VGKILKQAVPKKNKIDITVKHNDKPLDEDEIAVSGAHEIGHTGGLAHPKKDGFLNRIKFALGLFDENLMNQGLDKNQGTNITTEQMDKIETTIDANKKANN